MNLSKTEMLKNKKEADAQYYLDNKETIKKRTTQWNKKNRAYHREYDRRWRLKNPTKSRASYLRRAYKLSLEGFDTLKLSQNKKCAICLKEVNRLVIDHCHNSNKIRGLLCTTCYAGLGQFKDNVDLLNKAIIYIQLSK